MSRKCLRKDGKGSQYIPQIWMGDDLLPPGGLQNLGQGVLRTPGRYWRMFQGGIQRGGSFNIFMEPLRLRLFHRVPAWNSVTVLSAFPPSGTQLPLGVPHELQLPAEAGGLCLDGGRLDGRG